MTTHYNTCQDKYIRCIPRPKHKPKKSCCPHIENENIGNPTIIINNYSGSQCDTGKRKNECKKEHEKKCENKFKKKCECPVNTTREVFGDFDLQCGSSLKIFESDEPVEMFMEVILDDLLGGCNLTVKVLLQGGNMLEFVITDPNIGPGFQNGISFYDKEVLKVTLECEGTAGAGCNGFWSFTLPLRGSVKDRNCECPVDTSIARNGEFNLTCGSSLILFESDEPVEMVMLVELEDISTGQDTCDLKVIVDLEDGNTLEFDIPIGVLPIFERNDISFYSKNILKVTVECESIEGIGCRGDWSRNIILRSSNNV